MRQFMMAFALAFLLAVPAAWAGEAGYKPAEQYVDKVAGSALNIIKSTRDGKLSEEQAKTDFRKILNDSFDIPTIARFTMGKYWRIATPAEKQEFTGLLKTAILDKYADQILSFSGDKYTVDSSRQINDTDYGVTSTIYPANKAPVSFGWRLRKIGGGLKVIDISVEGVSMSVTHRSDFASVIERDGGKVQALLDALKNKEFNKE